jgi:hypothetical protein
LTNGGGNMAEAFQFSAWPRRVGLLAGVSTAGMLSSSITGVFVDLKLLQRGA